MCVAFSVRYVAFSGIILGFLFGANLRYSGLEKMRINALFSVYIDKPLLEYSFRFSRGTVHAFVTV